MTTERCADGNGATVRLMMCGVNRLIRVTLEQMRSPQQVFQTLCCFPALRDGILSPHAKSPWSGFRRLP